MNNRLKQFFRITLSFTLIFITLFASPTYVAGKTLGDLKKELDNQKNEYNKNKEQRDITNEQMKQLENEINTISNQITENQNTILSLENEIIELNNSIEQKNEEIKRIASFYQISNGNSTYLEYIFGASSFTDLIYRLAVSEQLVDYNDQLIDDFNKMIKTNNSKKEELASEEIKLQNKQKELESKLKTLGNKLSSYIKEGMSIEEEIKAQENTIKMYEEKFNCKDEDELSTCTKNQLPPDTSFWRPMKSGNRTSEYGYRTYTLNGKKVSGFHAGIDLSTYPSDNVPIYSAAAGVVAAIVVKSSCGGNEIYIHHNINGKTYTTVYMHLRAMLVKVGDVVSKDTQIGVMGGNPRIEYWDGCTTGAHLHFGIATGLYLKDYSSYSTFVSRTLNPRSMINLPSGGNRFTDRTTKY